MDAETRYELGMTQAALNVVMEKLDKLDEMEDMERHEALIEDRKPQLFAIWFGKALLMEQKEALA